MHIQISELAAQRMTEALEGRSGYFKLLYDTEGCGCNGVIVLRIVDQLESLDEMLETNALPIFVDPKQRHNLEEAMRLDAEPNFPSFSLVGDSGTYSTNIRIYDLRANPGKSDIIADESAASCLIQQN
ncbi:iron-sulfur cluster biosynthesis family protein [Paenibacillus massiliensis]|uniref:iron-sulfur cluster biosynthesis family protein n=1 Tax=Paenibacillus massiliensis TaxID=225917 RepID=UPI0003671B0A|nr:iron-sulfur cluster biosynthesis family protein [Paenibacillus massiliensis]